MKDFSVGNWSQEIGIGNISVILAISNILIDSNVTSSYTHVR